MTIYSDAVESCFRTIAIATPTNREIVFTMQAADAVRWAKKAGIEKIEIVDRLDAVAADIWPDANVRQPHIAAAAATYERQNSTGPTVAPVERAAKSELVTITEELSSRTEQVPIFSDEGLALRFAQQHADDLRFVAAWGKWQIYNDVRWKTDDTFAARDMARHMCREAAQEAGQPKLSFNIASKKKGDAVADLSRTDRRLAAVVDQWDADAWLFNTPGGVIDLRTQQMREHRPADYMRKVAGVAPDPQCSIETWLQFLRRAMGGDEELIGFLKRTSGYCLTGETREHALIFHHGTGANGKSTFINALTGCMGDYHTTAPIETFTSSAGDRHPTELAGLMGARLVISTETEENRRWAEAKIKLLTGGDKIAARFMGKDFFHYTPAFKLVIAGNHKPGLRSVDEAIRRRFKLVPWLVTIPPDERDETLSERLKAEWPGILAWAVDGCREWQVRGLDPPQAVRDATDAYLEAEDALAAWIEEATERDVNAWENSNVLYKSWKAWAERSGEHPGSLKKFIQRLDERSEGLGIHKVRNNKQRGFLGLRVSKPDLVTAVEPTHND